MLEFLNTYTPPHNITIHRVDESNCSRSGTVYNQRTVLTFEFDFMTWGGKGLINTNKEKIVTKKNRLFIRNPPGGDVVQGIAPYYCYYLTFDLIDSKGKSYDGQIPYPPYIDLSQEVGTRIASYFEKLYATFLLQESIQAMIESTMINNIFIELWENYKENYQRQGFSGINDAHLRIRASRLWMESHFSESVTLQLLAKIADLSPYYYTREFRRIYSQTPPMSCLRDIRLVYVKQQLLSSSTHINAIMLSAGFNNESYFFQNIQKKP